MTCNLLIPNNKNKCRVNWAMYIFTIANGNDNIYLKYIMQLYLFLLTYMYMYILYIFKV